MAAHNGASIVADAPDIDFTAQNYLARPWRTLRKLSEKEPLFWSDRLNAWVVTSHADVKAAYADARLSARRLELYKRALPAGADERYPDFFAYHTIGINFMDSPEHIRVRSLMMKAFGKKQVDEQRPMIAGIIEDVLDQAAAAGAFCFTDMVSSKLPTRVIQGMLGVPAAMTDEFFYLATNAVRALGTNAPTEEMVATANACVVRINEILGDLIEERRRVHTTDILSALVAARDQGDRLSTDELLAACLAILEAGSETTGFMLGVCIVELARRPDLRALVIESPDQAMRVVQELLRFPGLVMGMTRIVRDDFEWHGKLLKSGDIIFMMNCTANVDPAVFEKPELIDAGRDTQASLSFGPGMHFCIGHYLARAELAAFLHAAYKRFEIEVTNADDLRLVSSYVFRGYERIDVRFVEKPNS